MLILLLASLATTAVWLPVFFLWPHTLIAKALTSLWGLTFVGTCLILKWLAGFVDLFYERRGWPLR